jgi:uncharacterized protein (TIGR03435 family)
MNSSPSLAIVGAYCLAVAANLAAPLVAADQQALQQTTDVVFDVVSVKPNKRAADPTRSSVLPGGQYNASRTSLYELILTAYGIERFPKEQLVGGPSWIMRERFDIVAKATGELTARGADPTLPGALRGLLRDRFGLVVHIEPREFPVYALKVEQEGRLGPNLLPISIDCAAIPIGERDRPCRTSGPGARGRYFADSTTLTGLAAVLRLYVDRLVLDHTGLQGHFKVELNWATPPTSSLAVLAAGRPDEPLPSREGPSIFEAVQEQLGLTLEPTVASLNVVVIESAHFPTPD